MRISEELIQALEHEYDLNVGFIGQLRSREFDASSLARLEGLLASIDVGDDEYINRRLVALLWLMPDIIEWQISSLAYQDDARAAKQGLERIRNRIYDILGVP